MFRSLVTSIAAVAALLFGLAVVHGQDEATAPAARPLVLEAQLEGSSITPGTTRYLQRAMRQANERNAQCLVIMLDTPGGLLDSTRTLVREMLVHDTPVVVYVAPSGARAASAGVFITLASHVAVMAPGTTIGAAHPVQIGGLPAQREEEPRDDAPLRTKLVNDTVAWARALADERGRNAEWAAQSVTESATLTAGEAAERGVIDFVAADREQLLELLDGREVRLPRATRTLNTAAARVETVDMWWGERLLAQISHPNVAFLLLIFGFYGIVFELYSPGWGIGGTLGAVCLLLGLFGLAVLPVNYLGLALIAVALALFAAEVFVTSYGVLTIAGLVCLVLGGVMLVDSPLGFTRVSLAVVAPVAAATAVITLILAVGIIRAHRKKVQTGGEGMLGLTAVAADDFAGRDHVYRGAVLVHGERWGATSRQPIAAGQDCIVRGRDGLTLHVEPAAPAIASEPGPLPQQEGEVK